MRSKSFSFLAVWAIAFGCATGWGSFIMPGTTFLPKAGPVGTALGVLLGGAVIAVAGWNYARMMARHPGPGGALVYVREAFGIDHGFLCAWFLSLTYVAIIWANATALTLLSRAVYRIGSFRIETAPDGAVALDRLRNAGTDPFDLVLTDIWMPVLDGEGLVRAIRTDPALHSLRVVAVTADVEFPAKSAAAGFDGVLLKPVPIDKLSEALQRLDGEGAKPGSGRAGSPPETK